LQLLSKVLRMGKQGLVLVPEISLTPQLLKKFSNRFPQQVAVIHSHLTQRERTEQWWSVIRGEKKILVGARSALFCPLAHLGIIIIDEEHEPSFKQEEKLKYHARDSAIMLAKFHQCPVILGSATPSLESWHNARSGRYHLHILKNRVASRPMPQIEVVNMKQERSRRRLGEDSSHSLPFWLSQNLFEALSETFKQGQQAALFLNRRGIAQTVFCPSCGLTYECPNCSISLTLHGKSQLVCHYCDYHERLRDVCKECHSVDVGPIGLGTELIEQDIRQLFPEIIMARADRDEIQNRQDLEALIENFENHKTQLLIGTQMIAKGLDFKGLNLVGMVMADVGFHLPDFRASERSFQLLVQVSGRAGRHSDTPGRVVIQTYNPDHPSILHAINNQFVEFAEKELQVRNLLHYPPQGRIASFRIQGTQLEKARKASNLLGERCHQLSLHNPTYVPLQILGPAESPLAKLRGKYRFQILIKSPESLLLQRFCRQVIGDQSWIPGGVKVQIDIDPINLL
ncbi:MAG: primosomal protein N', partial [Bdellovibrionales bacterium]|nr:primosomal protein N' [Bdellovibrionales bacterium]